MPVPLYYAVRVTTPTKHGDHIARKVIIVESVEQLNDLTHNAVAPGVKVETKYLGSGKPIYGAAGPLGRYFHTEEQRKSYEAGLMGHGIYPLDQGPLDNFNYMGEQDAEILWDAKHEREGDEE